MSTGSLDSEFFEHENELFFEVSPDEGLSTEKVKWLTSLGYNNYVKKDSYKSVWQIVFDNVFTFFNLIFFILGMLLFLVHSYKDTFFIFVILANTLIGIVQQIRSKIKLDKLNLISALKTEVVRNGKRQHILNSEIVQGDILVLKTGDQITVDAVVLRGEVQIDESMLTGESDPITKNVGSGLLSGSFVLSGSCLARAVKVGQNCYVNKITFEAKHKFKPSSSEMIHTLDNLLKLIGVVLIPVGFLMFFKETFILHHSYMKAIQALAASIVGMIPEGLYLLTSMALAISIIKLMESKVLVHEMGCIETLARVDMLCVDKTGTITQPKMEVVDVVYFENLGDKFEKLGLQKTLVEVVFNMPPDSETAKALKKYFISSDKKFCEKGFEVARIHPFLSSTKWFAVEFKNKGIFILGAPEFIVKQNYKGLIADRVEKHATNGKRVLLFANLGGKIENGELIGKVKALSLVLIENPIRKTAKQTFEFFKKHGVEIKVLSGDNPVAVSSICRKVKIKNANNFVDASKLKTDDEIANALKTATVFGRVSPNQKKKFVQILQNRGKHTVAMTGDGVNDVLALRQANVGVAMASGSNAASQASEIVLLNSDFSAMPKVVHEGRRVINNIERSASLFLVKNIFSFCFVLLTLFFKVGFPITPFQQSCVSFFTIGMPSFLLTLEDNASLIKGKFLTNMVKKAMPGGICNVIMVLFVQLLTKFLGFSDNEVSAFCVVVLSFNGLAILFELCRPLNWKRFGVLALVAVLMSSALVFLVFSNKFSYFDFFSNYFVLILLACLFTIAYCTLKLLMIFFDLKIFRYSVFWFKRFIMKIAKILRLS